MLKIIKIEKNPKRKSRKKKIICVKKNPEPKGLALRHHLLKSAANVGLKVNRKWSNAELSKRIAAKAKKEFPKHYTKAKRNPPARKRHETMIVGYSAYHDWDRPKSKRYYFNGEGFSRKRSEAKIFSGDGAKIEAKRMLPYLPQGIYAIRVEKV